MSRPRFREPLSPAAQERLDKFSSFVARLRDLASKGPGVAAADEARALLAALAAVVDVACRDARDARRLNVATRPDREGRP